LRKQTVANESETSDQDKLIERARSAVAPIHTLATSGDFAQRGMWATVHRAMENLIHVMATGGSDLPDVEEPRDETAFSVGRDGELLGSGEHREATRKAMAGEGEWPKAEDYAPLGQENAPSNAMISTPPSETWRGGAKPVDPTLPPPSDQTASPAGLQNVTGDAAAAATPGDDSADLDPHAGFEQPRPGQAAGPEGEGLQAPNQQGSYVPQPEPLPPGTTAEDLAEKTDDPFAGEAPPSKDKQDRVAPRYEQP
jgi:hypothetical protein